MHATLLEVVGQPLYERNWLRQRILDHLDPSRLEGAVYLAGGADYLGHTIVRVEAPDLGLFSTTYVVPEARGRGIGRKLIACGEQWMRSRALNRARTYTASDNRPLQELFRSLGYHMTPAEAMFVQLERRLDGKNSQSDEPRGDTT